MAEAAPAVPRRPGRESLLLFSSCSTGGRGGSRWFSRFCVLWVLWVLWGSGFCGVEREATPPTLEGRFEAISTCAWLAGRPACTPLPGHGAAHAFHHLLHHHPLHASQLPPPPPPPSHQSTSLALQPSTKQAPLCAQLAHARLDPRGGSALISPASCAPGRTARCPPPRPSAPAARVPRRAVAVTAAWPGLLRRRRPWEEESQSGAAMWPGHFEL